MTRLFVSICWLVTVIHGIMKLRAVATLWLSNPQRRHPVCRAPSPWLLRLNTQRDQLYWQGHVPARWSLWGAWTYTRLHKLMCMYSEKSIFKISCLQSRGINSLTHMVLNLVRAHRKACKEQTYVHIHTATCTLGWCYSAIVMISNDETWRGRCGVWMGFSVLRWRGGGWPHITFLSPRAQFVCVLPRGNFGPFIMSVCAPVPSDTRVYLRPCRLSGL